jgi:peroxiredoxin
MVENILGLIEVLVIGKTGKVLREWRGVKVKGHAQEVLDFIEGLD